MTCASRPNCGPGRRSDSRHLRASPGSRRCSLSITSFYFPASSTGAVHGVGGRLLERLSGPSCASLVDPQRRSAVRLGVRSLHLWWRRCSRVPRWFFASWPVVSIMLVAVLGLGFLSWLAASGRLLPLPRLAPLGLCGWASASFPWASDVGACCCVSAARAPSAVRSAGDPTALGALASSRLCRHSRVVSCRPVCSSGVPDWTSASGRSCCLFSSSWRACPLAFGVASRRPAPGAVSRVEPLCGAALRAASSCSGSAEPPCLGLSYLPALPARFALSLRCRSTSAVDFSRCRPTVTAPSCGSPAGPAPRDPGRGPL